MGILTTHDAFILSLKIKLSPMNKNIENTGMDPSGQDRQQIKIIVQIDKALQDLIPGYLATRREDVQKLRRAIAEKDHETIRLLGHSMKGSGGGYGFDGITEIGRKIEIAAKNQDLEESRKLSEELKQYLDRVEVNYV
jgi:HPt (histidine-containing phosphotransfer) domain-containing protein